MNRIIAATLATFALASLALSATVTTPANTAESEKLALSVPFFLPDVMQHGLGRWLPFYSPIPLVVGPAPVQEEGSQVLEQALLFLFFWPSSAGGAVTEGPQDQLIQLAGWKEWLVILL